MGGSGDSLESGVLQDAAVVLQEAAAVDGGGEVLPVLETEVR